VRAKYGALSWLDEEHASPKRLADLATRLQELASETDVKHLPDYSPPRAQDLVEALSKFQSAKDALAPGDKAKFISDAGNVEFNLTIRWGPEELTALAVGQTISSPPAVMILAVKRPDYLGESQWEFRHGKSPVKAKIEDRDWLLKFQNRRVDVHPGDALKCTLVIESMYGYDNELIVQKHTITKVHDVLVDRYRQAEMFG
jgi:hypothetical protein